MNAIFEFLWYSSEQFREKYEDLVTGWQENRQDDYQMPIQNFGQAVLAYWKGNEEVREEYPELLQDIGKSSNNYDPETIMEVMKLGFKQNPSTSSQNGERA